MRPTESELEILQILWAFGPSTVRTVNERLNLRREVGYTTTLKMLQIMFEKGLVRRADDPARAHTYEPAIEESATQSLLVQQFMDATFRGSAAKMVLSVLGNHEAGADELAQIKALIEQLEKFI